MEKTKWFDGVRQRPSRPGVYLTRSKYYSYRQLAWWRAFDGNHWHVGVMAINMEGKVVSGAPDYKNVVLNQRVGDHISMEWCGLDSPATKRKARK